MSNNSKIFINIKKEIEFRRNMSLISVNEKQRIIVDQNQIKIGIDCLHQLIFVINDR